MFGSIGMPELIIILVIALIIFGPRKLPELGKSLGRSLNEFKKASTDLQNTLEQEIKIEEQKEKATKAKAEEKTASSAFDTDLSKFDTDKKDDDQNTAPPRETVSRPRHRSHDARAHLGLVPFPSQNRNDDEQTLPAKPGGFSPFGDDEEPAGEGRMTFLEHLDELRKRITHAVVGLFVGFIVAFAFINRVFDFVYQRLVAAVPGGKLDLHRSAARCSCCTSRSRRSPAC